jgi:hypothetical protein
MGKKLLFASGLCLITTAGFLASKPNMLHLSKLIISSQWLCHVKKEKYIICQPEHATSYYSIYYRTNVPISQTKNEMAYAFCFIKIIGEQG